jgi:hypothetical protein
MEKTIDGNASLKDQENTLNFAEQQEVLKLVSYVRGGTPEKPHDNLATFEDRDIAVPITALKLAESPSGTDIWVGGVLKKVAVSR